MSGETTNITEPDYQPIKPCGQSQEYISDLAGRLAEVLGYKPGASLLPLVKNLGGEIIVKTSSGDEDGAIDIRKREDFTIFLSPFTGPMRDRFTIAHELGHYFIHSGLGETAMKVARSEGGREEWEANWFAGGFLMPQKAFKREWKKSKGHLGTMASIFAVSTFTVHRRAKELKLIKEEAA